MRRHLLSALKKEFLQFRRDRLLVGLIFFVYTADLVMCTVALTFDVTNLTLAVYDQDRSALSRRLIERFSASEYFARVMPLSSRRDIEAVLHAGEADLALSIPPSFASNAEAGRAPDVQIILSGVNSNVASAARGYADIIVERFAHDVAEQQAARHGVAGALPEVVPRIRVWYNPELQFRHFMAVSMLVVAALMVGVITTAASLVREKETGTAEQLMVTPLRPYEVVIAKMAPPFAIGMVALAPSLAIARAFGVPLSGNIAVFVFASAIALAACMAIGIFISTLTRTLQQALLVSFFVIFPLMFLSGTTVPLESMPKVMQYLSNASPIRYYMEIAVALLLKGVDSTLIWPQMVGLAVTTFVLLALGFTRLKNHLYV